MYGKDETEQIVDYLTDRIKTLTRVNIEVEKSVGYKDSEIIAKIHELEDVRSYIAVNFC